MAGVFAADGHMDNGSGTVAFNGFDTQVTHQPAVSGGHLFSVDLHHNAVAADFLHFTHPGHINRLSPGFPDADGDGINTTVPVLARASR